MSDEANLDVIALTDHDTVDGVDEFLDASEKCDIQAIPGIEISCEHNSQRYHVLGYNVSWENDEFVKRLKYYEEARADRIRRMVEVLHNENIEISFEEIQNLAGKSLIGKPHVAQALEQNGIVDSVREAFDKFLGHGQLLDSVPKERMSLTEAIEQIQNADGVPILAHPIHYEDDLEFAFFKEMGIEGIEVFYSDHTEKDCQEYTKKADELKMIKTGGSDFHGDVKPEVKLGDVRLPLSYVDSLKKRFNGRINQ